MIMWTTLLLLSVSAGVTYYSSSSANPTWFGLSVEQLRQEAERHEEHLSLLETEARHGVGGILLRNCSEIDWTFEYGPPFLHMSLPMCGDVIRPNMILKRENLTCELDPAFLPNNQTRDCVAELMTGGQVSKLVIVIHGFLKSLSSSVWMLQLSSLLTADPGTAVLLVGWGHGSGGSPFPDPFYYYQAAANTRYMGVAVARMVTSVSESLLSLTNSLDPSLSLHCVGHSLGAHICGFTGATLANISSARLARISGLDPAGPLFASDVPYPFNWLNISHKARLNKGDADFVDVIHTDGKARFHWSIVPQYGTMTQLGHVDFFPGSSLLSDWGWNQPGCWQFEDVGSCSHSRSHDLFISSVSRPCHALQSCSNSTEIPATCSNISSVTAPVMGWWAGDHVIKGQLFTVNTTATAPFCAEMRPVTTRKSPTRGKKKRRRNKMWKY